MPLYKKISKGLTLVKDAHFESCTRRKHSLRYTAIIGLGSNIEDELRRFYQLKIYLQRDKRIQIIKISPTLINPPFGYLNQRDFSNLVIKLSTAMQPKTLMRYLLRVENHFGRKRSFKDAPRTLDLDMIFFENRTISTPFLTLPHYDYANRLSVTIPLQQIDELV